MRRFIPCLIILLFILILFNQIVSSEEIHFSELERTTDIEIIVFDEKHSIFQEKMSIRNNFNSSVEINTWFPITWPYLVNKTEYSTYPYKDWKLVNSSNVEYVNASDLELQFSQIGVSFPPNYLKSIETYPLIPGIKFTGTLDAGQNTGFATKIEDPSGLIEMKNGKFLLFTEGLTEGQVNSNTVKIPHKLKKFLFFDANLEISEVVPSFFIEPYDPEYKIYRWETDFLYGYAEDLERDLTLNSIELKYSYTIPIDEILIGFFILIVLPIIFLFLGIFIQKKMDKKTD